MNKRAQQFWLVALLCALACGAVSCTSHYTLRAPADLALLPSNRGLNGGSFVALTDWQYRGSDSAFHYFWHYYNLDNSLRRSSVRIPRAGVALDFPEYKLGKTVEWVTMRNSDPQTFHFVPYPTPPA
ncbi:MAG TPA: hypothetical protein VLT36_05675 [Candidatus Dormibacteraeota bacterium]|nr:hypothetical protein [Candidatus Dormibacteraeota bacterium]